MSLSHKHSGVVIAVAMSGEHRFSKTLVDEIHVAESLGIEGDAHQGDTVQHLSRVKADPSQPNLRQVHLMHAELFDELRGKGFDVNPAELGENITTGGIDLLALPRGTVLKLGDTVELEVTGLRNPCGQIEQYRAGLLAAVLDRGPDGELIRKAGIMSIVKSSGSVRPGDTVEVFLPPLPHRPLERV